MNKKITSSHTRHFDFGKNWTNFLSLLNEQHIHESEKSLKEFMQVDDLCNKKFIDVGSGPGLSSLAARRLGADVVSFDYDPMSVSCVEKLYHEYYPNDNQWTIFQGSVLDKKFIDSLGTFDICYSWGVLHHTGNLWQSLENIHPLVKPNGLLYIAIYNDQKWISVVWRQIKKTYNSGWLGKILLTPIFYSLFFLSGLIIDILKFRKPTLRYKKHKQYRGMSLIHDWKDWLGGYPYEVATPEKVRSFFENLGYKQINFKLPPIGFGNNQYLFFKEH